jgi:predicted RNase H-like HicB family nuclease
MAKPGEACCETNTRIPHPEVGEHACLRQRVAIEWLGEVVWVEAGRVRNVMLYPGEDGYWVAECPSLPPCISQGRTREDAIENIREAIQLYLEVLEDEGRPIPEDHYETIAVEV